jgi:hypothetical protein
MHAMRTTAIVMIGLTVLSVTGPTAQTKETKATTDTRVEVKHGKDVIVTGCVQRLVSGDYALTGIRENGRDAATEFVLVGHDDLFKHVGQRVEIRGQVVTSGEGIGSTESQENSPTDSDTALQTRTTGEGTTGAVDRAVLGVSAIKSRSSTCR